MSNNRNRNSRKFQCKFYDWYRSKPLLETHIFILKQTKAKNCERFDYFDYLLVKMVKNLLLSKLYWICFRKQHLLLKK